ncbi:MAG TPA: hypothetical protein ENJ82_07830 [Bacteroidetes bacterium]|nr:hypothetical protein [Bacteroidota bacterium]
MQIKRLKIPWLAFLFLSIPAVTLLTQGCDQNPCSEVCEMGTCVEGDCICQPGFEGLACDQRQNLAYIGDYHITNEQCNAGGTISTPYDVVIFASASTPEYFTLAGLHGEPQNLALVQAKILPQEDKFIMDRHEFSNEGLALEGEGSLRRDISTLSISYRLYRNDILTDSCTATLTRF